MTVGRSLKRWLGGTSNRTFILYPIAIAAIEFALSRGELNPNLLGVPLLAWGYLQYRLCGRYRTQHGGGGPGVSVPPQRLVAGGPYRYVRNPMYGGHLIFMLGLAVTVRSWIALALLAVSIVWFDRRVREDERRLSTLFGAAYVDYAARVKRWLPWVV